MVTENHSDTPKPCQRNAAPETLDRRTIIPQPCDSATWRYNCAGEVSMVLEDTTEYEHNPLQQFVTTANIFKDGQMTKADFMLAQENCTGIQEMIENGRPKTVEVEGIRCVISRNNGDTTRKYKPVIPLSILYNYAITLHLDMHTYHQTSAAIIRKIKQHFFILDEGVVKKALGGCYLCQISTPHNRH